MGALVFLMSGRQKILSYCWHFHIQCSNLEKDGSFMKLSFIKPDSCQLLTHKHTWGAMTQPPHAAPGIIPVLLAVLDPSLPWIRNTRGSWQRPLCCFLRHRQPFQGANCTPSLPCEALGNLSPTAQRPLHFRGCRGPATPSGWGSASCPPWGSPQAEAHSLWFFGFASREKWPRQWWPCQHPRRCCGPLRSQAQCRFLGPNKPVRDQGLGCLMEMQWHQDGSW